MCDVERDIRGVGQEEMLAGVYASGSIGKTTAPRRHGQDVSLSVSTTSTFLGDSSKLSVALPDEDTLDTSTSDSGASHVSSASQDFSKRSHDITCEIQSSILSSQKERATNENVGALTMNKLRFSSLGLHGRDEEHETLKRCLERLVADPSEDGPGRHSSGEKKELVLISGSAGSGKTALALSLADRVESLKGLYLSGKFDLYRRDEPYSGIVAACQELCRELIMMRQHNSGDRESTCRKVCSEIVGEIGEEVSLLFNIIPLLEEVVDDHGPCKKMTQGSNSLEDKERLKHAFCKLIRIVSACFKPLVIMLDDLQCADFASLEMMQTLITDRETGNLMIIGCYRPLDEAHIVSKTIRDLHGRKEGDGLHITDISVGNLDVKVVNQIIMALLSIDTVSESLPLAEICHKRTLGNAFHLIIFLSMLKEEGLLGFNLGLLEWKWDLAKIETETAATLNVVELMKEKMKKLPGALKRLLPLAACLGSSFEEKTLLIVWEACGKNGSTEEMHQLAPLVTQAVNESFIEACGQSRYRWIHDRVQEAAMCLIARENLASFQFQVGVTLMRVLSEKELEAAIFGVVNLLNKDEVVLSDRTKRAEIASINLKAAEKAAELSAFQSAAKYGEYGIGLLPTDKWRSQRRLSLRLYSICAEAYACTGNLDMMQKYCEEIIHRRDVQLADKLRVHIVLIHSVGNGNGPNEALDLCLDLLQQLGCKFPKNRFQQALRVIWSLRETTRCSDCLSNDLPLMNDPMRESSMMLMDNLATYAYCSSNSSLLILSATRMVRWTLRYGMTLQSPVGFAAVGVIKVATGDFRAGGGYCEYALKLLENTKEAKRIESRIMVISWYMVFPWTKPFQRSTSCWMQGYKVGMEAGDIENALWNICFYLQVGFMAGKSLRDLEEDCRIYFRQVQELKNETILLLVELFWQMLLNLIGRSDSTIILTGEIMDEDSFLEQVRSMRSPLTLVYFEAYKSCLYSFFGEHKKGGELALETGDVFAKNGAALSLRMTNAFHRALSLFAMARETRKRKYCKSAKKITSSIKSWAKQGNPNVAHYVALLNAENAVLSGDKDQASRMYMQAVTTALRAGYLHDAALANERFGEFLLYNLVDREGAMFRIGEAIRCYSDWGAERKVQMLRKRHSALWSTPSQQIKCTE